MRNIAFLTGRKVICGPAAAANALLEMIGRPGMQKTLTNTRQAALFTPPSSKRKQKNYISVGPTFT